MGGGDVGMCGSDERMDATHLSMYHSVSNRARGKRSFLPRLNYLFFLYEETVRYSRYIV